MSERSEAISAPPQGPASLQRCAEVFDTLEATLLAEQQALLDRDSERLIELAEQKRQQLLDLKMIAVSLVELPQATPELRARLEASFERCRQLNQVNGGVVAASRGATEKALAALRGGEGGPAMYDSHGDTRAATGRRSLAQA